MKLFSAFLFGIVLCLSFASEPQELQQRPSGSAVRSAPVTPTTFVGDVRDLPASTRWRPGDPVKEIPRRAYFKPGHEKMPEPGPGQVDRLLEGSINEASRAGRAFDTPLTNFDGQGFSGVNPPDPSGEIGPNFYIQAINAGGGATVAIYDKTEPTPNLIASFDMDSLATGGSCTGGLGDPIVLYDREAGRWLLTEFSSSGNNICMYVSMTGDPVSGGWHAYGFTAPSFPDYPKYGVWSTDANGGPGSYIVTSNETSSGVYAMDRAAMLAGDPATFQRFTIADLSGFPFNAVQPADHDGMLDPPSGAPAVIMRQRDTEVHGGPAAPEDVLEIWHFDVDWVNEANTTLTQLTDIDVAELDSTLCGLSAFACMEQPGTGTTLDPLREVIMNRLQYRNFGDYEVLVGNFVTDVDATDRGGVRWFELRRVGGIASPWTLHQEGLISPDSDDRWMAASSMDQSGNIAIAYNVSSSTTFPGLRFTGRLADDPPGTMAPEVSLIEGSASNSSNRYGDYSAMGVDPADDCTFWFTGEYNAASNWSTRIASFRFDACGCDLFPNPLAISGGNNGDNRIDIAWNDSELPSVVEYRVQRSRTMGGPYTTVGTVADSSPGSGNLGSYSFSDTTVSGGLTYYYIVRASDGGACTSDPSNEISDTATGICLLAPLFDGLQTVSTPNSGICTLNLAWNAATAECDGPVSYSIYRSPDPDFDPLPGNLLASGVTGTAYSDADQLVTGEDYFYTVRATDVSNGTSDSNDVEVGAVPLGVVQPPLFTDDAGDTGVAQLTADAPWSVAATGGNFGPAMYQTGAYGNNECAAVTLPEVTLGFGNVLEFWSRYEFENSFDKGEVQISTDGGANFVRLEADYPGNSTSTTDACGIGAVTSFTGTNTSWERYTADLSAYDGQQVVIRFQYGTDGSVTSNGWFIDDIVIGNNASACATASSCEDNPIVDVVAEGPTNVCVLDAPALTAELTGGVGPFTYQWYRNGVPIIDQTEPFYQPSGSGAYNVRVRAASCPDEVSDGQNAVLDLATSPNFAGVASVTDNGAAGCGIEVDWAPANSICPGPIVYNVYRSTSPGVTATAENVVASALVGTSFTDTQGLDSGVEYHYLVEAIETSTRGVDGNSVEASVAPFGPNTVAFSDDGGDTLASQMTLTAPWTNDATGGNAGPGVYATGAYGNNLCVDIRSPAIPITGNSELSFWSRALIEDDYDKGEVQISIDGGANWERVEMDYPDFADQAADSCGLPTGDYFTNTVAPDYKEYVADLSQWAGNNAILRWQLGTDGSVNNDGWWVDDIQVFAGTTCATGAVGPGSAPDGRAGTTPLTGDRLTLSGDSIQVGWDATSCTAAEYYLIYGALTDVASYSPLGSECSIGGSGSFTWNAVPGGDLYFLVLGSDGAGTEGSWGLDDLNIERNGLAASGECGAVAKDTTGSCP